MDGRERKVRPIRRPLRNAVERLTAENEEDRHRLESRTARHRYLFQCNHLFLEPADAMEVLYFLQQRLSLIRHFYEAASSPFVEIKRQIEAGEPPSEPMYSEDSQPPFMHEWAQADIELEVLGRTCVSMLSDSMKLYFRT